MQSDLRMQLQIARTGQFGDIMKTAIFGLVALAGLAGFSSGAADIALGLLAVTVAAYGILGGGAALDDISALREDMDEATGTSHYGRHAKARNLGALKALSAVLLGAAALAIIAGLILS